MKILACLLTALLLAGCVPDSPLLAGAPSTTVTVLVPTACLALADVPVAPARSPLPAGGLREKVAALLADLLAALQVLLRLAKLVCASRYLPAPAQLARVGLALYPTAGVFDTNALTKTAATHCADWLFVRLQWSPTIRALLHCLDL